MGIYMVNGSTVEIPQDNVTAGDLKQHLNRPDTHQVVVTLPGGQERSLQNREVIPENATDISVLPAFHYGR